MKKLFLLINIFVLAITLFVAGANSAQADIFYDFRIGNKVPGYQDTIGGARVLIPGALIEGEQKGGNQGGRFAHGYEVRPHCTNPPNDMCMQFLTQYDKVHNLYVTSAKQYNNAITSGNKDLAERMRPHMQALTNYMNDMQDFKITQDPAQMATNINWVNSALANGTNDRNQMAKMIDPTDESGAKFDKAGQGMALAEAACRIELSTTPVNLEACLKYVAAWMAFTAISAAAWFVGITGLALNYTIQFTITTMADKVQTLSGINYGWALIRDLCNMTLIYILIYIAVNTILGFSNIDTKRVLRNLIIFGILINFSLFFTKVLIDGSNILTTQFHKEFAKSTEGTGNADTIGNISNKMAGYLNITSLYDPKNGHANLLTGGWNSILILGIGGSVFLVAVGLTFLYISALLLIRFIVLLFLLILSPIGYFGYILPATNGWAKKWWSTLMSQLVFAPLYMILILLVFILAEQLKIKGKTDVNTSSGSTQIAGTLASGFSPKTGETNEASQIFNFVLLIGLINAAAVLATSVASGAGGMTGAAFNKVQGISSNAVRRMGQGTINGARGAARGARGAAGMATAGLGASAGRNTVGRYAQYRLGKEKSTLELAAKAGDSRAKQRLELLQKRASSEYDLRNVGGMSKVLGKGGNKGGYAGRAEEQDRKIEARRDRGGATRVGAAIRARFGSKGMIGGDDWNNIEASQKAIKDLKDVERKAIAAGATPEQVEKASKAIKTEEDNLKKLQRRAVRNIEEKRNTYAAQLGNKTWKQQIARVVNYTATGAVAGQIAGGGGAGAALGAGVGATAGVARGAITVARGGGGMAGYSRVAQKHMDQMRNTKKSDEDKLADLQDALDDAVADNKSEEEIKKIITDAKANPNMIKGLKAGTLTQEKVATLLTYEQAEAARKSGKLTPEQILEIGQHLKKTADKYSDSSAGTPSRERAQLEAAVAAGTGVTGTDDASKALLKARKTAEVELKRMRDIHKQLTGKGKENWL
ncbi:MAG: hypothetical protein V4519_00370 [Patescibacteria group bacterium]